LKRYTSQQQNILKLTFRLYIELFNNDIIDESSLKKEIILLNYPKSLIVNLFYYKEKK
jgi:hypothetical protein